MNRWRVLPLSLNGTVVNLAIITRQKQSLVCNLVVLVNVEIEKKNIRLAEYDDAKTITRWTTALVQFILFRSSSQLCRVRQVNFQIKRQRVNPTESMGSFFFLCGSSLSSRACSNSYNIVRRQASAPLQRACMTVLNHRA